MLSANLLSLLKKIKPISPQQIGKYSFMLFGTGGYAKDIYQQHQSRVSAVIEYKDRILLGKPCFTSQLILPEEAKGCVLIGSDIGNYQYNQLKSLAETDHSQIEDILLVDPFIDFRNINKKPPEQSIVLLEHASGVARHGPLLRQFRDYFERQGLAVTSLCPLTLYYYPQYINCRDVVIFSGQRDLYDIGRHVFSTKKITYMEYGFFPQAEHFYLDKLGVSQDSSLMIDDLSWVEPKHLKKLNQVRQNFLANFEHVANDYVLVPLQVPDDPNIVKCSRFKKGMQEFIDYIVNFYPQDQVIMFKPHPKDPNIAQYDYRGKSHSDMPFLTLLRRASCVHGVTSGALYEAALAGIDVETEGTSILAKHQYQKDKLFAAMVDRQVCHNGDNLLHVLQKYSHLNTVE
ncbi:hypothetical protein AB6T38_05825 [Aliiglaciecola sp. SL4]|uniref:capsular polysaccharide export protein, LipB/KpsS family n=1 Tax=Aliiglaciecola sp. SL4 TaxID=3239806 RepID=UPI00355C85A6